MIDEKKLIEEVEKHRLEYKDRDMGIGINVVKELIENQPKVNYPLSDCIGDCKNCWKTKLANPIWTPRSEGLPKKEGFYLCTVVCAYRDDYRKVVKCWFSENHNDFMEYGSRVIAWRPMLEPYRES